MTTGTTERKVRFYAGVDCDEENRKTRFLLCGANIPYLYMGPKSIERFPHIEWGLCFRYKGLAEITRFVERWKRGDIPSPVLPRV